MILLDQSCHFFCYIYLSERCSRKIYSDWDHRQIFRLPSAQRLTYFFKHIQIQIMRQLGLLQKCQIFSRIHNTQIFMVIAYHCFCSDYFLSIDIHFRNQTDNKIAILYIAEQILFDDRLMMPFFQILIILLLLFTHHTFCAADQLFCINIHFLPGITDRDQSKTDIIKFMMSVVHTFDKCIICRILYRYQILISGHSEHQRAAEMLLQHFTYTDYNLIPIFMSKFPVKVLQSIDVHRYCSQ